VEGNNFFEIEKEFIFKKKVGWKGNEFMPLPSPENDRGSREERQAGRAIIERGE